MKFKLEEYHRNISDAELIEDVRSVAIKLEKNTVTLAEYEQYGKYHPTTLTRRFDSWFSVLEKSNLELIRK